jgi:hypothetical protein
MSARVTSTAVLFALLAGSSPARAEKGPPRTVVAVSGALGGQLPEFRTRDVSLLGSLRLEVHPLAPTVLPGRELFLEVETQLAWPVISASAAMPRPAASLSLGYALPLDEHWDVLATVGPQVASIYLFEVDYFFPAWEWGVTSSLAARYHIAFGAYVEVRASISAGYADRARIYPAVQLAVGWAWRPRFVEPPPS